MWRRAMRIAALGVLARSTHAWPLAGRQQCATRALSLAGNGLRLRGGATEVVWRRLSQDAATAPGPAPIARSSHELSLVDGSVLLFGGEHTARVPIDATLWTLAPQAGGSWGWQAVEARGDVPPPRIGHAQAAVGARLYVMGGRQGIAMDEAPLDDLFCFDMTTRTWERVKPAEGSGPAPSPRSFHRMVAAGPLLYVFGGCDASGRLADLHSFDTRTRRWTALPPAAVAGRGGAGFAALSSGSLAVVGGFAGHECKDVVVYDPSSQSWTQCPEAEAGLRPRSVFPAGAVPGRDVFVAVGGEVEPSAAGHSGAGGFANDVVLIAPQTTATQARPSVTAPVAAGGDAVVPEARGWTSMCAAPPALVASVCGGEESSASFVVFGGLSGVRVCVRACAYIKLVCEYIYIHVHIHTHILTYILQSARARARVLSLTHSLLHIRRRREPSAPRRHLAALGERGRVSCYAGVPEPASVPPARARGALFVSRTGFRHHGLFIHRVLDKDPGGTREKASRVEHTR